VTGLRIGIGRAILGAILAEALLTESGLGGLMMTFQALYDTPYMMATVVMIAVLGILVLQMPKVLENRLFRSRDTGQIQGGSVS
jgi:ABC-type nitrate/sulfonate/bicarbonate transport system permease component